MDIVLKAVFFYSGIVKTVLVVVNYAKPTDYHKMLERLDTLCSKDYKQGEKKCCWCVPGYRKIQIFTNLHQSSPIFTNFHNISFGHFFVKNCEEL